MGALSAVAHAVLTAPASVEAVVQRVAPQAGMEVDDLLAAAQKVSGQLAAALA